MTGPYESEPEVLDAVRQPTVNITSHVTEIKAGHVWTDKDGDTNGALDLGETWMAVHSPQQARELAAAASELADAMEAHAARQDGAR